MIDTAVSAGREDDAVDDLREIGLHGRATGRRVFVNPQRRKQICAGRLSCAIGTPFPRPTQCRHRVAPIRNAGEGAGGAVLPRHAN